MWITMKDDENWNSRKEGDLKNICAKWDKRTRIQGDDKLWNKVKAKMWRHSKIYITTCNINYITIKCSV